MATIAEPPAPDKFTRGLALAWRRSGHPSMSSSSCANARLLRNDVRYRPEIDMSPGP